jgi:hypothetical protein
MHQVLLCLALAFAVLASGCRTPGTAQSATGNTPDLLGYYGEPRPVSSEDIERLPGHLSLHDLFTRWGFPGIGDRGVGEFHSYLYDFRYVAGTDETFPSLASFDLSFSEVDVTAIYLVGGAPDQRSRLVWLSEKHVRRTALTAHEVETIPADATLAEVQSQFPGSTAFPVGKRVTGVLHRTPIHGYVFEFFFVNPESSSGPRLVSVYLSDGTHRILKWGHPVDLKTGEVYRPPANAGDPFAAEPIPDRFLR